MIASSHVIQRLTLDVTVDGVAHNTTANHWLDMVKHWLESELLPQLEAMLDAHDLPNELVLEIEKWELDMGQIEKPVLEGRASINLEERLKSSFEKQQTEAVDKQLFRHKESSGKEVEALVFFLKNGLLPWWRVPVPTTMKAWEQQLLKVLGNSAAAAKKLFTVLRGQLPRQRFLASFSKSFLQKIARQAIAVESGKSVDLQEVGNKGNGIEKAKHAIEPLDLNAFFQTAFENNKSQYPEENRKEGSGKPDATQPQIERTDTENPDETAIYIRNAGLVLLHPFFQLFFEKLGFAKAGKLLNPERAVQLLQVLATGQVGPEYDLAFNKLLCGLEPTAFLKLPNRLTKEEIAECEQLLKAAVGHWSKLGDTSPEGLQGTFLCRDGKLSRRPDGAWLLQVEQRGFDVLLADLPWSILMVKLPWMPDLLYVEWA